MCIIFISPRGEGGSVMMKRLICLMLGLVMVLMLLVSCSDDSDAVDEINKEASRYTTTLNFWIITESSLVANADELRATLIAHKLSTGKAIDLSIEHAKQSEEAQAKIAEVCGTAEQMEAVYQVHRIIEAINKITKQKFKTQVNLKYLLEADYYPAVEKAFTDHEAAIAEAKKNGISLKIDTSAQETILDEYGVPQLKYPEIKDYQVDILYMGNAQKLREYVDKEWLINVDGLMENSAVELSYYINKVLLDSCKYYGAAYGVPNNTIIGEYTFLAVDEALANEYLTTPEELGASLFSNNAYRFLQYVYNRAETEEKVYPIYSENGKVDLNMLHYWSYDLDSAPGDCILTPEEFSLFGGFYESGAKQGSTLGYSNILTSPAYSSNLQKKIEYEKTGADTPEDVTDDFITTDPTAKAAVRIVKGGWETGVALESQGYTVLTVEAPRATDEAVFGSMFCIGSHTSDEERAMEVIAYLNTNTEFRNLLQYGVENENYTLHTVKDANDNDLVYARNVETNLYHMDIQKTGNLFLAYPNSAANVLLWEYGKQQNLNAVSYPTVGLYFNLKDYKVDDVAIRMVAAVSKSFETYVLNNLASATEAANICSGATAYTTSPTGMANYLYTLLNQKGAPAVTYQVGEAVYTVSEADFAAALAVMANAAINEQKDAKQSPNALYKDWLANSGVND